MSAGSRGVGPPPTFLPGILSRSWTGSGAARLILAFRRDAAQQAAVLAPIPMHRSTLFQLPKKVSRFYRESLYFFNNLN